MNGPGMYPNLNAPSEHGGVASRATGEQGEMLRNAFPRSPRTFHLSRVRLGRHLQVFGPGGAAKPKTKTENVRRTGEPVAAGAAIMPVGVLNAVSRALIRTGRLSMDAILLIVFAPVIAIWLLGEKWQRRKMRS